MDQFTSTLEEMKTELQRQREAYTNEAKRAFHLGASFIFDNRPWLQAFSWEQGTAGFCDGDPCHFYVHSDQEAITLQLDESLGEYITDGIFEDVSISSCMHRVVYGMKQTIQRQYDYATKTYHDMPYEYEDYGYEPNEGAEEIIKVFEQVETLLTAVGDEALEEAFGDPVKVTVKRDGSIDIEETYFE